MGDFLFRFLMAILLTLGALTTHAQYEGDDVYDPFADYSEFEENSQEEADINFFRNGRFFNVALLMGARVPTGGMSEFIETSASPGISMSFWFSMRLALQFSYTYSQHLLGPIPRGTNPELKGNMSTNALAFDLKYYINTNNITRGLAALNPYLLGGFSQNTRNFSLVDQTQVAKEDGTGLDLGVGIEIPVARNEMFIGFQFVYTYVNFSGENNPVPQTNILLNGDFINTHFIFGFNFL